MIVKIFSDMMFLINTANNYFLFNLSSETLNTFVMPTDRIARSERFCIGILDEPLT